MSVRNFSKRSESVEEVSDYAVNCAECLLNLCSSISASKVETLISIIEKEKFELNTFREHVSSMADCSKITDGV